MKSASHTFKACGAAYKVLFTAPSPGVDLFKEMRIYDLSQAVSKGIRRQAGANFWSRWPMFEEHAPSVARSARKLRQLGSAFSQKV